MTASKPLPVVLVGVDGSEHGRLALQHAFSVADPMAAQVHAVTVVEASGTHTRSRGDPWASWSDALEKLRQYTAVELQRFEARIGRSSRIRDVIAHVQTGHPDEAITKLAAQLDAMLIVIGTHGRRGVQRLMMGSVADKVMRTAGCPVLIVREQQHDPTLVGTLRIEAPPGPDNPPHHINLVEGRHTYHFVPRNVRRDPNAMAPLVFHEG